MFGSFDSSCWIFCDKEVSVAMMRPFGSSFTSRLAAVRQQQRLVVRSLSVDKRLSLQPPNDSRGINLLHDPLWNKGTAFGASERERFGIRGLLPPRMLHMEDQVARFLGMLEEEPDDILKAVALNELHDRNETLFHRVLVENIETLAPLVYTPTVGRVCQEFGDRFRRPRGMYFSTADRGHFDAMMYNWPQKDVHICVVTDGSRILGLGDLGVNGMGIPVGKLALYCAAGGIAPHRVMPVMLDVGTNNQQLLDDPRYLGAQHPRLSGDEYFAMVDEFMAAMRHHFPGACVQFEDFQSEVAGEILGKYRDSTLCFNDDIQGTGCVALAGLLSALQAQGKPAEALKDQRILVAGAGSAGLGVAAMLVEGMVQQGLTEAEARRRFYICDKDGLIGKGREATLELTQPHFIRTDLPAGLSLEEVAEAVKPTILLGLSSVGGLFSQQLVETVQTSAEDEGSKGAIIFPLSNPTANAECSLRQALDWTGGRCVFASGSPFDPVARADGTTHTPSQCNNMFIFPGLGLGLSVSGAAKCTDTTLYDVSIALSKSLTPEERAGGQVFPSVTRIREVSEAIALATMESTLKQGLANKAKPSDDLEALLDRKTYYPTYVPLGSSPYRDTGR